MSIIELDPDVTSGLSLTEFGISGDEAPNSTGTPGQFQIVRKSVAGGGGTSGLNAAPVNDTNGVTLTTSTRTIPTSLGTITDVMHRLMVPAVSGVIWVAAPGREITCLIAAFLCLHTAVQPSAGIHAAYMVWEE
jgi:hypothetical protein